MIEKIVEGWTKPLDFQLLKDGIPFTAEELSGATISVVIKGSDGTAVNTSGKCAWKDGVTSVARVSLAAGDVVASKSPYTMHFKITDASNKDTFVPNDYPDRLIVAPA